MRSKISGLLSPWACSSPCRRAMYSSTSRRSESSTSSTARLAWAWLNPSKLCRRCLTSLTEVPMRATLPAAPGLVQFSARIRARGLFSCRRPSASFRQMQPAFALGAVFPPPAAGALVLAGAGRAGAGLTTDGDVPEIVERVVRHLLVAQVRPNVGQALLGQRVHLQDAAVDALIGVELHERHVGARRALIAPLPGDPRGVAREHAA